jgi:hypothetical protein
MSGRPAKDLGDKMFQLFLLLSLNCFALSRNPLLTPGELMTDDRDAICQTDYTKKVRHVSQKTKLTVCKRYGLKSCKGYVIDHYIPLAIGGSNSLKNLWPEEIAEAKRKDVCENKARQLLCRSNFSVALVRDWFTKECWK